MIELLHKLGLSTDMATIVSQTIVRLVLAAILGGVIGLEREVKRKPAGLRTNMFICFGAALFTILSDRLAGSYGGDHTRIAAQIIPGIGFIGAGSILHSRGSVSGLTTAATIFVVASIGMAAGGGLYLPAIFATLVILLALSILGWLERHFSLKPLVITYQARGAEVEAVLAAVNGALEEERRMMQTVRIVRADHHFRVQFTVDGTRKEHAFLLRKLREAPALERIESFGPDELD
jgi:putative Mg2+ transporter-C (MgtC) family protein